MIGHLLWLRDMGLRVPDKAIRRLLNEIDEAHRQAEIAASEAVEPEA
jgi:hypothetical protein